MKKMFILPLIASLIMTSVTPVFASEEFILQETENVILAEDADEEILEEDLLVESLVEDELSEDNGETVASDVVSDIDEETAIVNDTEIVSNYSGDVSTEPEISMCPTGGMMGLEMIEVPYDSLEVVYNCDELSNEVELIMDEAQTEDAISVDDALMMSNFGSQTYESSWDRYSSNYVYNLLSDKKKVIWRTMDKLCLKALSTTNNYSEGVGTIEVASFSDAYDMNDFLTMYRYSNPQYFFLSNSMRYGSSYYGGKFHYRVDWQIYDSMKNGSKRAACKKKFEDGIKAFKKQIDYSGSKYDVVKSVHDVVCDNNVYNYTQAACNYANEQSEYTQSAYGMFIGKETVCAGYSLGTELLLNDAGIDCMALTSYSHAWNKVRINDTWYNMDTTWADQPVTMYRYFLKSDSTYESDWGNSLAHTPQSFWKSYLPKCTKDSTDGYYAAGTITKPTKKVAAPVISYSNGKVTIKCSTKGAKIYYTVDGKKPSPSYTRSNVYSKSFKLSSSKLSKVKAIAVKDGMLDSSISSGVSKAKTYKITYKLDGGKNNKSNPKTYKSSKKVTLKAPTRKGYKFLGWYSDKKLTKKVTAIKSGSTGNKTLYAKWKKN